MLERLVNRSKTPPMRPCAGFFVGVVSATTHYFSRGRSPVRCRVGSCFLPRSHSHIQIVPPSPALPSLSPPVPTSSLPKTRACCALCCALRLMCAEQKIYPCVLLKHGKETRQDSQPSQASRAVGEIFQEAEKTDIRQRDRETERHTKVQRETERQRDRETKRQRDS